MKKADFIIKSKSIFTGLEDEPFQGAVVISGENISGESNSLENETSGNNVINVPDTIIEIPSEGKDIVISSELQTSNQEKQEILSEIDEALQGLLEVVGKVEIVDEERLDATLDSEVDKP